MPRIISMAMTTEAFLLGIKTVTRRFWKDRYAQSFRKGDLLDVWDRLPRVKSKNGSPPQRIGQIIITRDPYKQKLSEMSDEHFDREGGADVLER